MEKARGKRISRRTFVKSAAAVIKAMEGHTSQDSLKDDPLLIRDWDHKFIWASYVVRTKKGSEMKDRADFVEVLRSSPGRISRSPARAGTAGGKAGRWRGSISTSQSSGRSRTGRERC